MICYAHCSPGKKPHGDDRLLVSMVGDEGLLTHAWFLLTVTIFFVQSMQLVHVDSVLATEINFSYATIITGLAV